MGLTRTTRILVIHDVHISSHITEKLSQTCIHDEFKICHVFHVIDLTCVTDLQKLSRIRTPVTFLGRHRSAPGLRDKTSRICMTWLPTCIWRGNQRFGPLILVWCVFGPFLSVRPIRTFLYAFGPFVSAHLLFICWLLLSVQYVLGMLFSVWLVCCD